MAYRVYCSKIAPTLAVLGFLSFALPSFAATLSIAPATGTYTVDTPFTSTVMVASPEQAANAVSGLITFSADQLQVVSLGKSNSIVAYWVREPSYSNAEGWIKFEGIVPDPGFIGAGKRVLTVTFRPRKVIGTTNLGFAEGTILANDGQGTNILIDLADARYAIAPAQLKSPAREATTAIGAPVAPQVISPSHPDPAAWYSDSNPIFNWELSPGITGVNILADHSPSTNPGTASDGLFSTHNYQEVKDGSWYFHLRLRNAGGWGDITHFGFNIDTVPPSDLKLALIEQPDPTVPEVGFMIAAADTGSGLDYYEISVDGAPSVIWHDDGDHRFLTSRLKPGRHTLLAKAYDKAGNVLAAAADFSVASLPIPKITDYPREIAIGKIVTLRGEALASSLVIVRFKHPDGGETAQETRADQAGRFVISVDEKLIAGIYTITATVRDDRGTESEPSESVVVAVYLSAFWQWGNDLLRWLSLIVPIFVLLAFLILAVLRSYYQVRRIKRTIRRESREAAEALRKAFGFLREKVRSQLTLLEAAKTRRVLTNEEAALHESLRQSLNDVESYVQKEIGDIEKIAD